jgi:hypothetical protein
VASDPARDRRGGAPVASLLLALHLAALAAWVGAGVAASLSRLRARRHGDTERALARHRSAMRPLLLEQSAFALLLLSGVALMQLYGWSLTHGRWLGVKVGLVTFLPLPLEGMHAWIAHAWIGPGLRESRDGALAQSLVRGLGVEEMIRALELLLLTPGVPLLVWLSVAKPL